MRLVLEVCCLSLIVLTGCEDMTEQPRYEYYEDAPFFEDGKVARTPPPYTIARGQLFLDEPFYQGTAEGIFIKDLPVQVTHELLERGKYQYGIHCTPCHGPTGHGDGIVVRRGFPKPPSYHTDRLRRAPAGYIFHVITNGFGVMYPYDYRVDVEDRWAIIAYIRALQLSQYARADQLPPAVRERLEGGE